MLTERVSIRGASYYKMPILASMLAATTVAFSLAASLAACAARVRATIRARVRVTIRARARVTIRARGGVRITAGYRARGRARLRVSTLRHTHTHLGFPPATGRRCECRTRASRQPFRGALSELRASGSSCGSLGSPRLLRRLSPAEYCRWPACFYGAKRYSQSLTILLARWPFWPILSHSSSASASGAGSWAG